MFLLKQKKMKKKNNRKKLLKIIKKLTNPQNTKIQKQTNLLIFCKSYNEFNTILQTDTCNNTPLIWEVQLFEYLCMGKIAECYVK